MSIDQTLVIKATVPQAQFHALESKFSLFVGGYGSGKSQAMCNQAILDASFDSTALIALYAPSYDLVRLIIAKRITELLDAYEISYKYNKSENVIYTMSSGFGDFILRTLDNPERIVGYQSYRAHIDELDTLSLDHAQQVWEKVIARNRQQPREGEGFNRVSAYTTPEGYKFTYLRWVKNGGPDYGYVRAASYSNPFLPDDYLDALRNTYSGELVNAYIEGEFVNLTSGTVYNNYNKTSHRSTETIRDGEPLYIGVDFNVTKQCAIVYVRRDGGKTWHAVDELINMYDTPEMIDLIKSKWPNHQITVYPDASGKARKSVNASISDINLLQQAGFIVRAHDSNPRIKDRVAAMNIAIAKGEILINDTKCPTFSSSLTEQSYDRNGEPDKRSGHDHANDAGTYPIAFEKPIRRPVAAMNIKMF